MTDSAPAPLPLSIRNQDGLVCWTKQVRLIAQGLISAEENRRAGLGPAPTTFQADHSRTGKREGQAPPLRDGGEAFCA